jgi:hypothetical protein
MDNDNHPSTASCRFIATMKPCLFYFWAACGIICLYLFFNFIYELAFLNSAVVFPKHGLFDGNPLITMIPFSEIIGASFITMFVSATFTVLTVLCIGLIMDCSLRHQCLILCICFGVFYYLDAACGKWESYLALSDGKYRSSVVLYLEKNQKAFQHNILIFYRAKKRKAPLRKALFV